MDHDKTAHLAAFSKAFNGNDMASTEALTTSEFVQIFYEGPDCLDGRILRGATAACAAVVDRPKQLKALIHFTGSQQYQYCNRTFSPYQAQGEIHTTETFGVRAVEIYAFQDRKPASKDTYCRKITS